VYTCRDFQANSRCNLLTQILGVEGERREESRLAGNASQIEIFHNIPYLRMEKRFLNDKIISK